MKHTELRDRVALVTGAGSGIGAALCGALVAAGARVVASDRDGAALRAQPWAAEADCRVLDVTDGDAVKETIESLPRIDLCFNNAGIASGGAFETFDRDTIERVVDVNLRGVLHGTHAAYRRMIAQGAGHIVNTASMAGLHPVPYSSVYAATKHAVVGLSLSLRVEGAERGVRVSAVCPGIVDTSIFDSSADRGGYSYRETIDRTPGPRVSPALAAEAILRGVSRNDALIVFPRTARILAAAHRVAPTFVSRAVAWGMRPRRRASG